ncbi:hypothetical protein EON65_16825 [archaeon]|nr:MAG: hypothetical protein EON65_16825 [archaeon]
MKSDKGDRGSDSLVEYLHRPRSHFVSYWCARSLSLSDSLRKARKIVQHSVRSWVLSLEYEQKVHPRVCLWDYHLHQLLWSKSGAEIEKDASSTASTVSSSKPSLYIKTKSSTLLDNSLTFKNEDFSKKIEADKLAPNTSLLDILAIKFFDPHATGCRSEFSKCKAGDSSILVMTENYLVIYSTTTGRHTVIHPRDVKEEDKKVSSFASLDVIDRDRLILSMADGHVKVYNVKTKAVEQSVFLAVMSKAHITVLPSKM